LRGLTSNRTSSSGREDVLRRDFDMRAKNRAPFISAQQMTTLYQWDVIWRIVRQTGSCGNS
jgi:hypothetical protein